MTFIRMRLEWTWTGLWWVSTQRYLLKISKLPDELSAPDLSECLTGHPEWGASLRRNLWWNDFGDSNNICLYDSQGEVAKILRRYPRRPRNSAPNITVEWGGLTGLHRWWALLCRRIFTEITVTLKSWMITRRRLRILRLFTAEQVAMEI